MTKKELHKALRARIAMEQAKLEMSSRKPSTRTTTKSVRTTTKPVISTTSSSRAAPVTRKSTPVRLTSEQKTKFKSMLDDLIGTRGAYILNEKLEILGKVPMTELQTTIMSLKTGMYAIIFDGVIESELVKIAEKAKINFLIAMDSKFKGATKVKILTNDNL